METSLPKRIYLDLEYLYPGMTKESGRPTGDQLRQVVQIAAILFDHAEGKEVAYFDELVVPTFTKTLPPFFTELTGITDKQVAEQAIPFVEGLQQFKNFVAGYPVWIFNLDQEVLEQNCGYVEMRFPFEEEFERVKPKLQQYNIDSDAYSSGTLHKAVGVQMEGHVHNALHDVRSMAQAIHHLEFNMR